MGLMNERPYDGSAMDKSNDQIRPSGPSASAPASPTPAQGQLALHLGPLATSHTTSEKEVDTADEDPAGGPALIVDMENVDMLKDHSDVNPTEQIEAVDSAIAGLEERPSKRSRTSTRQSSLPNVTNGLASPAEASATASTEITTKRKYQRRSGTHV